MDDANPKLFDRSAYSQTTISIYQIVGAYYVDIYYNHLYAEAIKFKTAGSVPSITEGYRHAVYAFLSALDNKAKSYKTENYNTLLKGINEYFVEWTTYTTLTLSECIDKIVKEFVPVDYFNALDREQKRNILRGILIGSIREFTKSVVGEFLGLIIDNHDDRTNVDMMKDKMIDVFIMQREKLFHQFLDCRTGNKDHEKVDKRFVDKMRKDLIAATSENKLLIAENKELTVQLNTVKDNAQELINRFRKLKMRYDSLAEECRITRAKVRDLEEDRRMQTTAHTFNASLFADDEPDSDQDEEPTVVKHIAVKPVAVKPAAVKHIAVKPAIVKPVAVKPAIVKPVAVKPVAVKPPVVKPAAEPVAIQVDEPATKSVIEVDSDDESEPELPTDNEIDQALSKHMIGTEPNLDDIY
jgi:hypothetical protein